MSRRLLYWTTQRRPIQVKGRDFIYISDLESDISGQMAIATIRNTGRRRRDPLVEHADELARSWARHGPKITYDKLARDMKRDDDRALRRWFKGGRWKPFKRTGSLTGDQSG